MWKIILFPVLVVVCSTHAHRLLAHETHLSPTGLVFLKEDHVIMTGDRWNIVLVINATQHFKNAQDLEKELKAMEQTMKLFLSHTIYRGEVIRLRRNVNHLLNVIKAWTDMLDNARLIGDLGRVLFGGASNDEVQVLAQRVFGLQSRVAGQETFQKYHVTITKALNRKLEQNILYMSNLTIGIDVEIDNLSISYLIAQTLAAKSKDNLLLKKAISPMQPSTNLTISFRLLEKIVSHSLILANKLQAGLEMAAQGKLSFSLISPQELKEELIKIVSMLPFGLKLISGLHIEDMYKYREAAEVVAIAQNDLIMLSVRIPLLSEDHGFDLYKIYSLPVLDFDSGIITRIEPDSEYFLVSNNRQFYGLMSYEDLQQCSGSLPKICPSVLPLTNKNLPTCISLIYFKGVDNSGKYCKGKILVKPHRPIWLADKENLGWIFSVSKLTKVTLHCGIKETINIELIGTNILANVSHCAIHGQHIKLFRTSEGVSYSNGAFSLVFAKPIGPILDRAITEQLSNTLAFHNAVEELRKEGFVKEGQGNSEEVYLDILMAKMDTLSKPWYWTVFFYCVAFIITVVCVCLILSYMIRKIKESQEYLKNIDGKVKEVEMNSQWMCCEIIVLYLLLMFIFYGFYVLHTKM